MDTAGRYRKKWSSSLTYKVECSQKPLDLFHICIWKRPRPKEKTGKGRHLKKKKYLEGDSVKLHLKQANQITSQPAK